MAKKRAILLAACALLCACGEKNVSDLRLWMTYDEIAEILPHPHDNLMRNPMAGSYQLSKEEKRFEEVFGLNLEDEYGLILGFNEKKELILINRIERARPQP